MIPGVKGLPQPTKEQAAAFHENEANCNQCRHLKRVKHPKDPHGFLQGQCGANPFGHMFVMKFHPDDPMHMKCWEPRAPAKTEGGVGVRAFDIGSLHSYLDDQGRLTVETPRGEDCATLSPEDTAAFLRWLQRETAT